MLQEEIPVWSKPLSHLNSGLRDFLLVTNSCLVETFPHNHQNLSEYLDTLKYAFLYAKSVTLGMPHWSESAEVMSKNRRIGTSMSGIAQFVNERGLNSLKEWCENGYDALCEYDKEFSHWLKIPESIKKTSIKPSGTVSLLAGATPGIHFPISEYYVYS